MDKDKDQQLFSQISIDIREHQNDYKMAGESLDGYCKNIKYRQLFQVRCFGKARQHLVKKYEGQNVIPEDDARCIILITWLLTDADTDKADLNITQFEKWPWKPINNIFSNSRCAASSLLLQNAYAYGSWMRVVHIAWKTVESKQLSPEKPPETEQRATPGKLERENWLWKLYEKTLKVIIDAILEKMCPK